MYWWHGYNIDSCNTPNGHRWLTHQMSVQCHVCLYKTRRIIEMFVPSRGTMATTDYGVSLTFLLLLSQSGVCQFTFLTGVYLFIFVIRVFRFIFLTRVFQYTCLTGSALTCWTHTVCHQYRDTLNTEYSVGIIFIIITTANTATSTTSNDIIC